MSQQPTDFNPYQPATGPVGQNIDQSFLARTAKELARWQTFFAVLMTIGIVAMMGVMSFAMLADGGGNTGAEIGGLACVGGATILIYGLPAVMLWRAASAARDYARAPGSPQLAQFASSQLSFWRTIGIMAVVILGIYALIFVGAMMLNVTISETNSNSAGASMRSFSLVLLSLLVLAGCNKATTNTASPGGQGESSNDDSFPRTAGKYTVLGILTDNQDNSKAKENAETTLLTHPDVACLVGLWSNNTPMILAALRSSDAIGKVKVVGFDEHAETLAGIREGTVYGTIVQNPYGFGYRSVEWLTSIAKGKPIDVPDSGLLFIPHETIVSDNVQAFADKIDAIKAGNGPLLSPDSDLDGKGVHVAFITNSIDPFWTLSEFGCNKAAEQFGCKVDVQMPSNGSIEEQKRFLETNAANKIDGVAISPIDPANQVAVINEACESMTVICQDSDAPASKRDFYLGTSNYMAGRAAGKLIKEAVPDGGEVMLFVGKMEVLNAQERSAGIIDELGDQPLPLGFEGL